MVTFNTLDDRSQLKLQKNVESVKLATELHTTLVNEPGVQEFLDKIYHHEVSIFQIGRLDTFLSRFVRIAVFWHEELLTDSHVRAIFGIPLKGIRKDTFTYNHIQKVTLPGFEYLRELLDKSEEWGLPRRDMYEAIKLLIAAAVLVRPGASSWMQTGPRRQPSDGPSSSEVF